MSYPLIFDSQSPNGRAMTVAEQTEYDARTASDAKRIKKQQANGYYETLLRSGYTYSANVFDVSLAGQADILNLGLAAARSTLASSAFPWDATTQYVTLPGGKITVSTAAIAAGFTSRTYLFWSKAKVNYRDIVVAIDAAANQAALDAIDVTAGYPTASG